MSSMFRGMAEKRVPTELRGFGIIFWKRDLPPIRLCRSLINSVSPGMKQLRESAWYKWAIMKDFCEKAHFEDMEPYMEEELAATGNPFAKQSPLKTINQAKDRMIAYYMDTSRMPGEIHGLSTGSYEVTWFNPRTGEYTPHAEVPTTINGTWTLPGKPDQEDWLLVLQK